MNKAIKIILAILLLLCLMEMPYGYYQLVRFIGMIGFVLLAYDAYERVSNREMVLFVCLALLFQPFFKLALGRTLWNSIDMVVGLGLVLSVAIRTNKNKQ